MELKKFEKLSQTEYHEVKKMLRLKIERVSHDQAIIALEALEALVNAAKKVEEIEIAEVINVAPEFAEIVQGIIDENRLLLKRLAE